MPAAECNSARVIRIGSRLKQHVARFPIHFVDFQIHLVDDPQAICRGLQSIGLGGRDS